MLRDFSNTHGDPPGIYGLRATRRAERWSAEKYPISES